MTEPAHPAGPAIPPAWISIDGVDGIGKTTLARALAEVLRADLSSEFSETFLGKALLARVTEAPNYVSVSLTAQSLAFIGDFFEVHATQVAISLRAGRTVVTDRGWLSKYAYQLVTLTQEHGAARARRLLDASLGLLPEPDLTLYLTATVDNVRQRIVVRDGHCDDRRLEFLRLTGEAAERTMSTYRPDMPVLRIDANPPPDVVLMEATNRCRRWLSSRTDHGS